MHVHAWSNHPMSAERQSSDCCWGLFVRRVASVVLNASLGLFGKKSTERSTVRTALRPSPHQKGRNLTVISLGGLLSRPFFLFATLPQLGLTNLESISTLFRVEIDSSFRPSHGSVRAWPIPTADR